MCFIHGCYGSTQSIQYALAARVHERLSDVCVRYREVNTALGKPAARLIGGAM